jgi:hypothetical protein
MRRFVFIKMLAFFIKSLGKGRVGEAMSMKKGTKWLRLQEDKRSESTKE